MIRAWTFAAFALLAACATVPEQAFVAPQPTGDALVDNALLLAAGEAAPDAATRAALVARLDAAGVRAADGAPDDPLTGWRTEAAATGTQPVYRGRALGPAYRRAKVAAGATMRLEQIFLAGQSAEIAAAANGGTGLTLSVRDRKDAPVCSQDVGPSAKCRWLPLFTERYAIELHNKGKTPASVYLVFK